MLNREDMMAQKTEPPTTQAEEDFLRLTRNIEELGLVVEENREEIWRRRRLPDAVAQAFVDLDIYRLLVPRDLDGAGITPLEQFDFVERIAYHEASAGWNFAVGSSLGIFSGFLDPDAVCAMFTQAGAAMAGSGAPQGKAHKVEGGYRVEGRFSWASGIDQACWVYGGCFVYEDGEQVLQDDGAPATVLAFAPKQYATVHDCWNVSGLVATNSTEFSLSDVFVPVERTFSIPWKNSRHPGPLFRLPMTFFGFALTGVPLGVARRAVDGLRQLAVSKLTPGGGTLADTGFSQYAVAKAEAMLDAARCNVRYSFQELWDCALADKTPGMEARARLRRACVHAAESSQEAVTMCYRAAGGSALFSTAPFEAALRDVNAICGHLVFQRSMMEDAGRVALGLAPKLMIF
jgi:alkylation response protein AidB-like acyl-CoA dehydrogenase